MWRCRCYHYCHCRFCVPVVRLFDLEVCIDLVVDLLDRSEDLFEDLPDLVVAKFLVEVAVVVFLLVVVVVVAVEIRVLVSTCAL